MALEYFCCYHSYLKKIAKLSDQEVGRLFRALLQYSATAEAPELTGREGIAFDFIAEDIDRAKQNYADRCQKNAENVRNRWDTKDTNVYEKYDRIRSDTKDTKTNTKTKTNTNQNSPPVLPDGNTAPKGRMVPPTVDEVAAYCRERGNGLDPETFVDFYASKGWMVGKNPMKDWKAAVRTWERSEGRGTSGAGNRVQPRATEEHGLDKLRRLYEEEFGVE